MVVTDGLVSIWLAEICNHHYDYVAKSLMPGVHQRHVNGVKFISKSERVGGENHSMQLGSTYTYPCEWDYHWLG